MKTRSHGTIPAILLGSLLTIGLSVVSPARAEFDGARVYWPLPKNTNIVSAHLMSGTANASWSNWSALQPDIDIQSDIYMLGYTRVQPVFGRTVNWQLLVPAGTTRTSSILPVSTNDTFANGIGDIGIGGTVNLFGVPELMAKDFVRHELDLSVNLGLMVYAPTGQYDPSETLNIGSNQWKTRVSAPIVKSFGQWVPGRRTTLEIMPAVTFFGDNDEVQTNRIEQDPLYSIEAHFTRDLTERAFVSLDYTWLEGGEETFFDLTSGATVRETNGVDSDLLGVTLGFEVNDNLRIFVTHMQTLSEDSTPLSLEGSLTKISFSWSWHDVLQRVQDFRN